MSVDVAAAAEVALVVLAAEAVGDVLVVPAPPNVAVLVGVIVADVDSTVDAVAP